LHELARKFKLKQSRHFLRYLAYLRHALNHSNLQNKLEMMKEIIRKLKRKFLLMSLQNCTLTMRKNMVGTIASMYLIVNKLIKMSMLKENLKVKKNSNGMQVK